MRSVLPLTLPSRHQPLAGFSTMLDAPRTEAIIDPDLKTDRQRSFLG
jgi:hypothetical protein